MRIQNVDNGIERMVHGLRRSKHKPVFKGNQMLLSLCVGDCQKAMLENHKKLVRQQFPGKDKSARIPPAATDPAEHCKPSHRTAADSTQREWHACWATPVASDSATPWTAAHQAPLSMGPSRQEYWSGFPCPSPGDLPEPRIKPQSPT